MSGFSHRLLTACRDGAAGLLGALPGDSRRFGPPRRYVADTPAAAGAVPTPAVRVRGLTGPRPVQRPPAPGLDAPLQARATAAATVRPRFVAELPAGRFWGRGYGYVIDARDALHGDLSPCFDDFAPIRRRHDGLRQPWLPRVRRVPGTVAVLHTLFCENFHHWLLDATPKFGLLREAGWTWDRIDWFALPASACRPWHGETLQRLGIAPEKILWTTARTHLEAACLLVPSYSEPGREPERYDYTPEGLAFVRQLFAAEPDAAPAGGWPEKIVVSRERTSARRWLAGEAGHRRLAALGFAKVLLEDYSLAAQAALFRHARVVVMPTGGGLANLVHCRPGTRIVELFSPAYLPTFSLGLCASLGLDYRALVAAPEAGAAEHADAGGARDIAVPVERVLAHVG